MMNFLSYLINGISLGSVYAIIALGYTMVYGIAKMLNFAHGDIIMVGGFTAFTVVSTMGGSPIVGILAAVVVCTALGVAVERIAYRPLRDASPLAVLITAIGVSYLLQNVALLIFGSNARQFTSVVNLPPLKLAGGELSISSVTIVTILACVVIMAGLMFFINKTKIGQAMLAVSEDRGAATLMGINVNRTIAITFAIGSALARYRLGACRHRRRAPVLLLAGAAAHDGRHAWHQGLRGGCIRRNRFHSRRPDRRRASGCNREPDEGVYFVPAFRRDCIFCAHYCAVSASDWNSGQKSQ